MRRKVGVSVVRKKQDETDKYDLLGKSLKENKLSFVQEVLGNFQKALSEFASKHKDKINNDPEFRQQFHAMCISAGVDPLASSKGFWADILGVGDFYFELGVKIVQLSVQTRALNGGIMALQEACAKLNAMSSSPKERISAEDVRRAVEKLSVLGSGFRIVSLSGSDVIVSVPMEINNDHEQMMEAAQIHSESGVTKDLMERMYGWSSERFDRILLPLLSEGMIWVDQHLTFEVYYFPSLWSIEGRTGRNGKSGVI